MNQQKKINSLYIHIPFCSHLCAYCDFTKLIYNEKFASNYLESVFFELDSYNIDKVKTLYIGGGTYVNSQSSYTGVRYITEYHLDTHLYDNNNVYCMPTI